MEKFLDNDILEFDLGQKWSKGLRIRFCSQNESQTLNFSDGDRMKQVHSDKAIEWSHYNSRKGYENTEADAFIAGGDDFKNSKRKLYIKTADCAPLFYVDAINERVAAIHAGWRGLAQNIHLKVLDKGFDPKTTWIWCGPCLNSHNFEVGEDMWSKFSKEAQRNPLIFSETMNGVKAASGKMFFSSWNFLNEDFSKRGVELFYNVEIDTFEDIKYASYRRWGRNEELKKTPLQHNYSWIGFV